MYIIGHLFQFQFLNIKPHQWDYKNFQGTSCQSAELLYFNIKKNKNLQTSIQYNSEQNFARKIRIFVIFMRNKPDIISFQ